MSLKVVQRAVMCVANIAEFQEQSHKPLLDMHALPALTNLLKSDSPFPVITDYTREKAAIAAAVLSNTTSNDTANAGGLVDRYILDLIMKELSELLGKQKATYYGSSVRQLFLALQLLAISDSNAKLIVEAGVVPLIVKALSPTCPIWTARQV